jgi:dTDP-4-dehydrorhamnose reductase
MKIAVIGADGQLGTDVCDKFEKTSDALYRVSHAEIDIASLDSVTHVLSRVKPDVIVNAAAFHHVEQCELDPTTAFAVNGLGARNLALVARDLDATIIHVSTDYVFDGAKNRPYDEEDVPRPLNVYGNSKLAGEYFVRSTTERHLVLRTSALYGKHPCRGKGGLNFVELMLKLARERDELKVVDSEVVTPTSTTELARQIVRLSRCDAFGLYHATAEGSCSWYEFAREIFTLTDTKIRLKIAGPNDFPVKVPRPKYSVLENRGLKAIGENVFQHWQEGLRDYLGLPKSAVQIA